MSQSTAESACAGLGRVRGSAAVAAVRRVAPACSADFRLGLLGQVPVLRDRRRRHRPGLGPRRHAHPGPGRVLRPRRLHDGHAPQDRRRRARGNAVPDFMQIAGHPRTARPTGSRSRRPLFTIAGDRRAPDARSPRPARPRGVQAPGQGRVLRDPVAGAGRRAGDPARRPGHASAAATGSTAFGRSSASPEGPGEPADAVLHRRGGAARSSSRWSGS